MRLPRLRLEWREISRGGWAPFLIASYAITFLYEHNIDRVTDVEVIYALAGTFAGVGAVLGIGYALLRNWPKTVLSAAVVVLYVFSMGHLWEVIQSPGTPLTSQAVSIAGLVLASLSLFLIGRVMSPGAAAKIVPPLNLVSAAMLVFTLVGIGETWVPRLFTPPSVPPSNALPPSLIKIQDSATNPDIYYIILDGYSSNKFFMRNWDYDNSAFTDALEARGFTIAYDSTSNYAVTLPSMASSLNMRYLIEGEQPANDRSGNTYARILIADNEVARQLQARGYTYILMMSGWERASTIADTNVDFYPDGPRWFAHGKLEPTDKFVKDSYLRLLVGTTALRDSEVANLLDPPPDDAGKPLWFQDPQRALATWDTVPEVASMPEATFTIVHIIKPHGPISFDRSGTIIPEPPRRDEEKFFFEELEFVNRRTLDMIDEILKRSDVPPIIIIQGDHGHFLSHARGPDGHVTAFEILNAYHFPNGGDKNLYQTISTVNSFRVMFNTYFDQSYELLADDQHYELLSYKNLFDFEPFELP